MLSALTTIFGMDIDELFFIEKRRSREGVTGYGQIHP
jgi:hypothetical protein